MAVAALEYSGQCASDRLAYTRSQSQLGGARWGSRLTTERGRVWMRTPMHQQPGSTVVPA
eukprot:318457-Chlamydomonas_euryale.AAC.2